ncbi:hypothetical protein SOVF_037810 [Spinacia oleracea]|nr:hypothetical protein SOVF_037810 [Spinacia oleracea]
MTSTEVNEIFGWPCDGTIGPTEFDSFDEDKNGYQFFSQAFWKEVTGRDDWRVGLSKAFSFVNPAIRLWRRIITQVLYARKDLGNLTTKDFKMLWWFVHGDKDKMGQLDFGKFLIDAFIRERQKKKENITIVSFVTIFAEHVGVPLSSFATLKNMASLTHQRLEKFELLSAFGTSTHMWYIKGATEGACKVSYALLPNPATRLGLPNALLFTPITDRTTTMQASVDLRKHDSTTSEHEPSYPPGVHDLVTPNSAPVTMEAF